MIRRNLAAILVLAIALPACAQVQSTETISIAAASDLVHCLEELNAAFKQAHPQGDLKASIGSSGNFFAQIQNGAPFDVFLSADVQYPQALIKAGLADSSSMAIYAIGRIVLWTVKPDLEVSRGLQILRDTKVQKFAIANPEHAPYGRAAKAALEHYKLWQPLQAKIVLGDNIAQTAQFVQTGNVDAGIVALSFVVSPKLANTGKFYEIPEDAYARLEQAAVLTKHGTNNPLAETYLAFIRSAEARTIFNRYGFRLPK